MRCKKEQKRIEDKASRRLEWLFGKDEMRWMSGLENPYRASPNNAYLLQFKALSGKVLDQV